MWPGGEGLHLALQPLLDSRDGGTLLLSHLYLLLGLSLPLWISPLRDRHHGEGFYKCKSFSKYMFYSSLGSAITDCMCCHAVGKVSLYSGVLALGVGDAMAALAGSLMGRTKWPGRSPALWYIHSDSYIGKPVALEMRDQLWQPWMVQGTSCGSRGWSKGPVVAAVDGPGGPVVGPAMAAVDGPGDHIWQPCTVQGNSCGSRGWSKGTVVAAVDGPGDHIWQLWTVQLRDQLWQPWMVQGTIYGSRGRSGGPVVAAVDGPGDQLWQPWTVRGTSCGSCGRSGGPVMAAI